MKLFINDLFTNHFKIMYQLEILLSNYSLTKHEHIISIVVKINQEASCYNSVFQIPALIKSAEGLVIRALKPDNPNEKRLVFAGQVLSREARNQAIFQENNFAGGALTAIFAANAWRMAMNNCNLTSSFI